VRTKPPLLSSEEQAVQDLNVITVKIETLKNDPENARKHSEKNLSAIAKSLEKFGQRKPIVVWQGFVIAGNGTLEAAKKLGWTDISITTVPHDWSHEQARAYAIADNRTSELAEWDDYLLANQLIELDAVGWDIADFGFDSLKPPEAPTDFDAFDDSLKTQYKCPKCEYEWNGAPR
jgi:ParB-like chromosome segregation protein Spo0J